MKKMILYFLVFVSFSLTSSEVNLNLTGTYETKKNIDKKGNNLGNEGFIMVKDLGNSKIKLQLELFDIYCSKVCYVKIGIIYFN